MTDIEEILEGFLTLNDKYIKENKLQKMCYILDLYWCKEHGKQLTKITYEKYGFGPFSGEITQELRNLASKNYIKFVPYSSYRERIPRKYSSSRNNINQLNLDEEVAHIMREILNITENLSQEELDSWSKETILFTEDGHEIDFRNYRNKDYQKDLDKLL